jgi:hypothetical protein
MPAPNAVTAWCLGQSGSCSGFTVSIADATRSLKLSSLCGVSCDTCAAESCPPVFCAGPVTLNDQGQQYVWDGTYITLSTCGASGTTCNLVNCAGPGQYTATVCGFPNPDPSSVNGCDQESSASIQFCVPATFEYPTNAPVLITMRLPLG